MVAIGLVFIVFVVAWLIADETRDDHDDLMHPAQSTTTARPARITAPIPVLISHAPPEHEYTIGEAHMQTQLHRECSVRECPRKAAAFDLLVATGHVTPAKHRVRA